MMHAPDLPRGINETNEKTTYLLGGWVYVILTSTHLPTYLPTCGWSALLPVGRSLPCRQKGTARQRQIKDRTAQRLYSTYSTAPIGQRRGRGRVLRRGVRGWYGGTRT